MRQSDKLKSDGVQDGGHSSKLSEMRVALATWFVVHLSHSVLTQDEKAGSASSSLYSTKEVRDMCLKEWAGKTQEVQDYFDQLPSKEFKENSEDLKLKLYYERKGVEDVDSTQIYNITSQVRNYPGSGHTVEVNDSYVPKYRMTTSEEIRIEEEGTFHSQNKPDHTMEHFESQSIDSSEIRSISESDSSVSSGSKTKGKKTKKEKGKWPKNMDPKEKRKKKKKDDGAQAKRKELVENRINGLNQVRLKTKKLANENKQPNGVFSTNNLNRNLMNRQSKTSIKINGHTKDLNLNQEKVQLRTPNLHASNFKMQDRYLKNKLNNAATGKFYEMNKKLTGQSLDKDTKLKNTHGKRKDLSIFDEFMGTCKLRHRHKHERNLRARRRPPQGELPRPFL